jgi:uncharacterized protein YegP (UPF0339 family)
MNSLAQKTVVLCALTASVGMLGSGLTAAQGKKDAESKAEKAEKAKAEKAVTTFEVYKDSAGEFRFRMKHGETLLAMASKGYETKAECEKVIDIIKRDAAKAKIENQAK